MASLTPSIAIAGLGAVGGSLARALARAGASVHAYSPEGADRNRARADGLNVHDAMDASFFEGADMVVIAVPLDRIADVARTAKKHARPQSVITHVGSLQRPAAIGIEPSDTRWLIGTHPIAGSEVSGYRASDPDMFVGATVSADASAPRESRHLIESVWRMAGASGVVWRAVEEHDRLMTWASHLPQLASMALALAVARAGIPAGDGGPGLRDTTRLAASSLLMWRPILDASAEDAIEALNALQLSLADLRNALETGDQELLSEMWTAARAWRGAAEAPNAR